MPLSPGKSAPAGYSRLQIALHWTTVALILAQLVVNEDMRSAFRERLAGADPALPALATFHVVGGIAILVLTLLRLAIRATRGAPPPVEGIPPLLQHVAAATHVALYAMLLLMPVTGALAWFGGLPLAAVLHETGRLVLVALIVAHAFGALVEHWVMRNETLLRMLRGGAG